MSRVGKQDGERCQGGVRLGVSWGGQRESRSEQVRQRESWLPKGLSPLESSA